MSIGRFLPFLVAAIALVLSPLTFPGGDGATAHTTYLSASHDGDPDDLDHKGPDHGLVHCGSYSCVPSYNLPGGECEFAARELAAANRARTTDDAELGSLYVDCDPPVPRTGFSLA